MITAIGAGILQEGLSEMFQLGAGRLVFQSGGMVGLNGELDQLVIQVNSFTCTVNWSSQKMWIQERSFEKGVMERIGVLK